ncbi:MAG: Transcriptional regulator [Parcubacteria group bacterium GW2011_GWC1_41_7]|nr:MAG: Transcriptional regulator [Parcubacteria group bacterium GW2011_GWC1_41_7]
MTFKNIFFFLSLSALSAFFLSGVPNTYFYYKGFDQVFAYAGVENILLLGKPGAGYYGGENTDSIVLLSIRNNGIALVYIPRDLVVQIGDATYKINSLIPLGKQDELLREVSKFSGMHVDRYFEFDLALVRKLIDSTGGIDVTLQRPVVDAVSGFTLPAGKHHLNGEWAEFVIRSRYAPEGDFFRMKNQVAILKALGQELQTMPKDKTLSVLYTIESSKQHYHTNLKPVEIVDLFSKLQKASQYAITEAIPDFQSGLWKDGSIRIIVEGGYGNAYGLYPKEGIGDYTNVRAFIRDTLK